MAVNKQYKADGYDKRRNWYSVAFYAGAILLAGFITYGLFTLEDVKDFVELVDTLFGVIVSAGLIQTARVARNNVEPPTESTEPGLQAPTSAPVDNNHGH